MFLTPVKNKCAALKKTMCCAGDEMLLRRSRISIVQDYEFS